MLLALNVQCEEMGHKIAQKDIILCNSISTFKFVSPWQWPSSTFIPFYLEL